MTGSISIYGVAILAVILYGILPVLAKKSGLQVPPFTFMAIAMATLTIVSITAALLFERDFLTNRHQLNTILIPLLFGLINFVAFTCMLFALKHIPVAYYQLLMILSPLVAAGTAYLLLGETITVWFAAALPVIFVGLYLALVK